MAVHEHPGASLSASISTTCDTGGGWPSQEAFAYHVGLDRTYISGLERGTRNPTLDVIVKLTHGLQMKPADLATVE